MTSSRSNRTPRLILLLALTIMPSMAGAAVVVPDCVPFNGPLTGPPSTEGFFGANVDVLDRDAPGASGAANDYHLHANDGSGASYIFANGGVFRGNYNTIASGTCGAICYSINIRDDANQSSSVVVQPVFDLLGTVNGSPVSARFQSTTNATEPAGAYSGWHRICAPIAPRNADGSLPHNDDGAWSMTNNANWNALLTNVTDVRWPVDLGSSASDEDIWWDDVCISDTDGCSSYINKDFVYENQTMHPEANNFEMILEGVHSLSDFKWTYSDHGADPDPLKNPPVVTPYPTAGGPNTLLSWTLTDTAGHGEQIHIGFAMYGAINILSVYWTFDDVQLQCAHQVDINAWEVHGDVTFTNRALLCESQSLYVGNARVEYHSTPVALENLNATSMRSPLRIDEIPGGPFQIDAGESLTLPVPDPPLEDGGVFRVVTYTVSSDPGLAAGDNTRDYWMHTFQNDTFVAVPMLTAWGLALLALLISATTIYLLRRRRADGNVYDQ